MALEGKGQSHLHKFSPLHPQLLKFKIFFKGLKGTSVAALSVLPDHCDNFKDPIQPLLLPKSYRSIRNHSIDLLTYDDISNH